MNHPYTHTFIHNLPAYITHITGKCRRMVPFQIRLWKRTQHECNCQSEKNNVSRDAKKGMKQLADAQCNECTSTSLLHFDA